MGEREYESGLVTVSVTTHNRSALLQRALAGVMAQTWPRLEIVVSDDASTDDTEEVMAGVTDARVRYARMEKPGGIAGNFQNALDHARGELFMILNDDDELEPEAIKKLAGCFFDPPEGVAAEQVVLSWCRCKIQDGERKVRYVTGGGPGMEPGIDLVTGLFDGVRGPRYCGILVRTRKAEEVGFRQEHGGIPDVGNWTRVCVRGGLACCVDEPLARYTAHNNSETGTAPAKAWQLAGEAIIEDLLADLQGLGDTEGARRIRRSQRNFITGLLATILMHSAGRPGWMGRVLKEFVRAPQYFVTPMTVRRLVAEGGKLLK